MPPYYNEEFFEIIKHAHNQSPLNVAHMTEKQWHRFLLEYKVTMIQAEETQKLKLQIVAEADAEYPIVWFLGVSWMSIWDNRKIGRRTELYKVRADLEAKVSLLREAFIRT